MRQMKKMNWREQRALAEQHARQPIVGDYWHEMFIPVCVVIEVVAGFVLICKDIIECDDGKWTWDLNVLTFMHGEDFYAWLHYGRIDGCWADVEPKGHPWVCNYVKALPRERVFPGWMEDMEEYDA